MFCSKKCSGRYSGYAKGSVPTNKGKKMPQELKEKIKHLLFKKGHIPWNNGMKMSEEHCKNLSIASKGIRKNPKGEFKKGNIPYWSIGENHYNWQGGATKYYKNTYRCKEYIQWRKSVFERDNYTCQFCGDRGGKLHSDHIKSFIYHQDLRYDISNGRTLCVPCHKKTPTYGWKNSRVNQIKKIRNFYKSSIISHV